ncbi:MAG TPA: hypothetical protein VK157_08200 [Phycisphaerales bacterium]|nr:hypothetical protein [Phycisphaerales bacterium]
MIQSMRARTAWWVQGVVLLLIATAWLPGCASRGAVDSPAVKAASLEKLDANPEALAAGHAAVADALDRFIRATAALQALTGNGQSGSLQAAEALREYDEARAAYIAALAAEYRPRLAYTWWQAADGSEQIARVRESIAARDELLARWSPLGDRGFSRREVESILGQAGREEPSEHDGYVTVVVYWWDNGRTGSGLRVRYEGEARSFFDRAVGMERVPGK